MHTADHHGLLTLAQPDRLIRRKDLPGYVGLERAQISELIKSGDLPAPIPLSDSGRKVAWLASEIAAWQASRVAKRDAGGN
jgi:prophage regulatory protein